MQPLFPIVIELVSALRSAPLAPIHIFILQHRPYLEWISGQIRDGRHWMPE